MKFIIYTIAGSAFMLVGILALFFTTGVGTFDLFRISEGAKALPVAAGAAVPAAVHRVRGEGADRPVPPGCGRASRRRRRSACCWRDPAEDGRLRPDPLCVTLLPGPSPCPPPMLVILGVVGVIYGAMLALAQIRRPEEDDRLPSVSHMGYVIVGLAALTFNQHQGRRDADVHLALITALLFTMVGLVTADPHGSSRHGRAGPRCRSIARRS